jgi:hypothetical protein
MTEPAASSNPYAAPNASVADASAPPQGRPGWVWAITIFFGFGLVGRIVTWTMIATNSLPMDAATRAYYQALTAVDYAVTGTLSAVNLAGVTLLFLMRAKAAPFLAAGLSLGLLNALYRAIVQGPDALLGLGAIGLLGGFLVWGAIVWYAYRLKHAGRLR